MLEKRPLGVVIVSVIQIMFAVYLCCLSYRAFFTKNNYSLSFLLLTYGVSFFFSSLSLLRLENAGRILNITLLISLGFLSLVVLIGSWGESMSGIFWGGVMLGSAVSLLFYLSRRSAQCFS